MPPKAVNKVRNQNLLFQLRLTRIAVSFQDALLIILDCGPDSTVQTSKDGETFFSRAKKCVLRIFEQKIFGKSSDEIGLLLMGGETKNRLYDRENEGCYENLEEILELKLATWASARFIDEKVQPSETQADFFDALVLGMDILKEKYESRFYNKMKIVLITNFASALPLVSEEMKNKVIDKLKNGSEEMAPIELIVM